MSNIENNSNENTEISNTEEQDMSNEQMGDELEASAESDAEGTAIVVDEKVAKEKAAAAHLAFVTAAKAHAEALGLSTKDQKGFFQVLNAATGHKLYVAKQGRAVTRIDTTLPMSELDGISYGLSKPNGRIQCHVNATNEAVTLALDVLASFEEKIPAPKKALKATPAVEAEAPAAE